MASITVARALTKQKTILDKINKQIAKVRDLSYTTNKEPASKILTSEKDLAKNHAEAAGEIAKIQQSITDSIKFYLDLSTAIARSNLDTYISTTELGNITVAEAILIYQKLNPVFSAYASAMNSAVVSAENKADRANRDLRNSNISTNMSAEMYAALEAMPVLFFNVDYMKEVIDKKEFIINELNLLINESNAITTINVGDEPTE